MTMSSEATPLAIEDYDAIEAAVMETARGRWFLTEYARRHRQADTLTIVETLERIERTINRQRKVPDIDRIRLDLADMAEAIIRTKQEIFQMKVEADEGGRFAEASNELDAIVSQTEQATETILQNAEKAQELAWTLRENGAVPELCDQLDEHITEIYTGCSFQDLTGQRTRKVVTVLRYLESRINSMTGIWGIDEVDDNTGADGAKSDEHRDSLPSLVEAVESAPHFEFDNSLSNPFDTRPDAHLLNGPQLVGRGIDQTDVDSLMDDPMSADDFVAVRAGDTHSDAAEPMLQFAAIDETVGEVAGEAEVDAVAPVAAAMAAAEPVATAEDAAVAEEAVIVEEAPAAEDAIAAEAATIAAEADMFADADVFVISTTPANPPAVVPEAPAAAPSRAPIRSAAIGNTALAVSPAAMIVAAPDASPALMVVKSEDPIANLSSAEKLIVFG
ncbi:MAG: chemotaxis protein [Ancalomicrobiaceae bacterium]|nr:chemotaxis protein [Ancalomicrobiaceae bacterium]